MTDAATLAAALLLGVNLSGAEFGAVRPDDPGRHGRDYVYPAAAFAGVDYTEPEDFAAHGATLFRVPFRWERLQPVLGVALDTGELERLKTTVRSLSELGAHVVIDPHNYARYHGAVINGGMIDSADFADFWRRLAVAFMDQPAVMFGLMNEPRGITHGQWVPAAQAAIDAIRDAGAENMITVPGIAWTGAHSWVGSGNAAAMVQISDPLNNMVFEAHQYCDANSSGTDGACVAADVAVARIAVFTNWLRAYRRKGFIGEFGGGDNPGCDAALDAFAGHVAANDDIYVGWAMWGPGPWWAHDYVLKVGSGRLAKLVR